mmetsp:Transcript_46227/g.150144  ORF Transcript_46227/g.150144 Transcript_46227/m.150144 type:complete len:210 (+) Transcript_46227:74-703(+)
MKQQQGVSRVSRRISRISLAGSRWARRPKAYTAEPRNSATSCRYRLVSWYGMSLWPVPSSATKRLLPAGSASCSCTPNSKGTISSSVPCSCSTGSEEGMRRARTTLSNRSRIRPGSRTGSHGYARAATSTQLDSPPSMMTASGRSAGESGADASPSLSATATPEPIDSPHRTSFRPAGPPCARSHFAAAAPSAMRPSSLGLPSEPPKPR